MASGRPTAAEWRHERSFPTGLQHAFDTLLAVDLARLFDRWHGPLPAVKEVRDQDGRWGDIDRERTVATADGGTMRERLLVVDRPRAFRYRLDHVTGPLKPLVSSIDGAWEFRHAGTGVRIAWSWTVRPASRVGALALPPVGRLWQGYARKGFDRIEELLVP